MPRATTTTTTTARAAESRLKRAFDIVVSAVLVVVLLPVLLVVAVMVWASDGRPALFRQERAGRNGRPFQLLKFRTMRKDADPYGVSPHSGDDPRLIGCGRFLRQYSLDELPQLLNVLKGEMSLVGPRPLYVSQIAEWNDTERRRLAVRPGITGLAQVKGRGALTREAKLALDVEYVDHWSFGWDLRLLFATVGVVSAGGKVYEQRYSETEQRRGQS